MARLSIWILRLCQAKDTLGHPRCAVNRRPRAHCFQLQRHCNWDKAVIQRSRRLRKNRCAPDLCWRRVELKFYDGGGVKTQSSATTMRISDAFAHITFRLLASLPRQVLCHPANSMIGRMTEEKGSSTTSVPNTNQHSARRTILGLTLTLPRLQPGSSLSLNLRRSWLR